MSACVCVLVCVCVWGGGGGGCNVIFNITEGGLELIF